MDYNHNNHYMNNRTMNDRTIYSQQPSLAGVYGWMSFGLLVTALTALFVVTQPKVLSFLVSNPTIFFGIFLLQIALVVVLSSMIQKLSFGAAAACFIGYSALTGLSLSTLAVVYTGASLATTFGAAALMFGIMAVYGYVTNSDLSSWGSFLLMGLIGLVIANIITIFTSSPGFELTVAAIGILIFSLLTAYDVQRIKQLLSQVPDDHRARGQIALLGALTLYLNFINIFLHMLQFLGKKRE
jgi:FtsH-binding integral membrane protein